MQFITAALLLPLILCAIARFVVISRYCSVNTTCRFVLAAVSPAVVVPSLLALHTQGYGVDKGIPTLVIAASSIDDVIAITGFGVVLGITFSTG